MLRMCAHGSRESPLVKTAVADDLALLRDATFITADADRDAAVVFHTAAQLDQERPIVFYCRSGARSAMTTQAFRASGFQAFNLTGGLLAWVAKGLPIVPDGGTVADHYPGLSSWPA